MEAKHYATKQPVAHRRNQRGNQKYVETNEIQLNTIIQNVWNVNTVLRGKFTTSGNKKNLKWTI